MGFKIFISYSSRGPAEALRLKEIAEAGGHDAWMDLFDIRPSRLAWPANSSKASRMRMCYASYLPECGRFALGA